jgi:hypothetical protein
MSPALAFVLGFCVGGSVCALWHRRLLRPIRASVDRLKAALEDAEAELAANVAEYQDAGYRDPLYELRQVCQHVPEPSGYGQVCRICGLEL